MASTTDLYSYNGEFPKTLPNRIRLSDGSTRTDISSFTDDDLVDSGYIGPLTQPENTESVASISWDSGSTSFMVVNYDDDYYRNLLQSKVDGYLGHCDWTVASDSPLSESLKSEWEAYRTSLNGLVAATADPENPVWPDAPAYTE